MCSFITPLFVSPYVWNISLGHQFPLFDFVFSMHVHDCVLCFVPYLHNHRFYSRFIWAICHNVNVNVNCNLHTGLRQNIILEPLWTSCIAYVSTYSYLFGYLVNWTLWDKGLGTIKMFFVTHEGCYQCIAGSQIKVIWFGSQSQSPTPQYLMR